MIHVSVREKHQINWRQLVRFQGWCDQTFGPNGAKRAVGADAVAQDRVRQYRHPIKIQQHRRVSEPRRSNGVGIPGFGRGGEFGLQNGPSGFRNETTNRSGR